MNVKEVTENHIQDLVPDNWDRLPIGDLMSLRNGVNADGEAYGKGTPFINVLEVITNTHLRISNVPGKVQLPKGVESNYLVDRGDILFNRTSETQEEVGLASVYVDDEATVFGGFVIRGQLKSERLSTAYAGYALRAPAVRSQIISRAQGAVRANIGQQQLSKVCVPLPPLPEQRAIAAALSDVDALIARLDALIAKKRALKTATMQRLLTGEQRLPGFSGAWTAKRLGEIGSTYGGLTGKRKKHFGTGSAKYIPFLNIMNNVSIDLDDLGSVDVSSGENQNSARKADLFFNTSSETPEEVGMCSTLQEEVDDLYLNSFCFGFRLLDGARVDNLFLTYLFRSGVGRDLIYSLAQGATRYNLSKSNFVKLEVEVPDLAEQEAIANVLSDMDAEIEAIQARRDKTQAVKQGMMQELLTGRTRLV